MKKCHLFYLVTENYFSQYIVFIKLLWCDAKKVTLCDKKWQFFLKSVTNYMANYSGKTMIGDKMTVF